MLFFRSKPTPPPSPDASHRPSIGGQTVVDVLYSPSQRQRVVITSDAAGAYRSRYEFWDVSDWEVAGVAFWCQRARHATFADSLATARSLASEYLRVAESESTPSA